MVSSIIKFQDFFDKSGIVRLQQDFIKYDAITNPATRYFSTIQKDLVIEVEEPFYIDDDKDLKVKKTIKKEFVEDYLKHSIKSLSKKYFEIVVNDAENTGVYTEEARRIFVQKYISITRSYRSKISKVKFMNDDVLTLILEELDILEDTLESFIENPYPKVKKKIQFNWIRTDVEVFFHLLRENKQIADIGDADLGRIIDNMCECKSSLNSNSHNSINGSSKHLNAFKNSEGRPDSDAIRRLQTDVFKKDFFKI